MKPILSIPTPGSFEGLKKSAEPNKTTAPGTSILAALTKKVASVSPGVWKKIVGVIIMAVGALVSAFTGATVAGLYVGAVIMAIGIGVFAYDEFYGPPDAADMDQIALQNVPETVDWNDL